MVEFRIVLVIQIFFSFYSRAYKFYTHKKSGEKRRKLVAQPDKWVRNVAKANRNMGESYISNGVLRPAKKTLREPCGDNCRLKCNTKITEAERESILNEFWELGDLTRKREYIIRHMEQIIPKYLKKKEGSKRSLNYAYNFYVNGQKIKVCSTFFLNTLNVSYMTVATAVRKFFNAKEGLLEGELRGKNKIKRIDVDVKIEEDC